MGVAREYEATSRSFSLRETTGHAHLLPERSYWVRVPDWVRVP